MSEPEFIMAINKSEVMVCKQEEDQQITAKLLPTFLNGDESIMIVHNSKDRNRMEFQVSSKKYSVPSHVQLLEILQIMKTGTVDDLVTYSTKYLTEV